MVELAVQVVGQVLHILAGRLLTIFLPEHPAELEQAGNIVTLVLWSGSSIHS
jgi:hypothetical protein